MGLRSADRDLYDHINFPKIILLVILKKSGSIYNIYLYDDDDDDVNLVYRV